MDLISYVALAIITAGLLLLVSVAAVRAGVREYFRAKHEHLLSLLGAEKQKPED